MNEEVTAQMTKLAALGPVYKLLLAVIAAFVTWMLGRFVRRLIQRMCNRSEHCDPTLAPFLGTLAAYSVYFVGAIIVLGLFGVNTASLIAMLGAAGVAVALALKDTLSNVASGIMLLFLRPLKIGEVIDSPSGSGEVMSVGLFATELKTIDGVFISIPNSSLSAAAIRNYSRNPKRRVDLSVTLAHADSVSLGMQTLLKLAQEESRALSDPSANAVASAVNDEGVQLTLCVWVNSGDFLDVQNDLLKKMPEALRAAGLTIAAPRRLLQNATN